MSNEAITWALTQPVKHSTAKFVLVVMANHADKDWIAFPSVASLAEATAQDRKTVLENLKRLVSAGYLEDTNERKGVTKQVIVYRLKSPEIGTVITGASHYIYRLTDESTGQFYVGVRSCQGIPENDRSYMGSGVWPQHCARHGVVLRKEVLSVQPDRLSAEVKEAEAITLHLGNPLCMNSPKTGLSSANKSTGNGAVTENQTVPKFPTNSPVFPYEESRNSLLTVPKTGHGNLNNHQEPTGKPNKREQAAPKVSGSLDLLLKAGVDEQTAADWLKHRGKKKASDGATVIADRQEQAGIAGITLAKALQTEMSRGWQGFSAAWLQNGQARASPAKPSRHSGFDSVDYNEGVEDGRIN